jgi:membrane-associated phospholipid phosphatase
MPLRRDPWAWVGVLCLLAFLGLTVLVARHGSLPIDEPVASAVRQVGLPVDAWILLTTIGAGGGVLALIDVAFVLAVLRAGPVRLAVLVGLLLLAGAVATDLVKDLIARPRPTGEHLVAVTGFSFPSGHTTGTTVTFGLMAVVAWRSALPLRVRQAVAVLGVAMPFLVGCSRVALGVHFPSDVLGGWLLGTSIVALGATLMRTWALVPGRPARPAPVPPPLDTSAPPSGASSGAPS